MLREFFILEGIDNLEFNEKLNKINLKRSAIFAIFIMIIEIIMLSFSFMNKAYYPSELLEKYQLLYSALLALSVVFLLLIYLDNKQKIKLHKYTNLVVKVIILLGYTWGALISILDISTGAPVYVYLTFILVVPIVLLVSPVFYLFALLLAETFFLILLPVDAQFFSIGFNTSVCCLFAFLVGRLNYHNEFQKYRKDLLIEEKNNVLERQNNELVRLTQTDYLTGLYNRFSLDDILAKKWFEAYINKHEMTVLMIDINSFKLFNDTFGHVIGDECLKQVSRVLLNTAKEYEGYAFRYGGDEFCLVFNDLKYLDAVLDLLNSEIEAIKFDDFDLSLSIGIFKEVPNEKNGEWVCIEKADKDLYIKKANRKRRKDD